MSVNIYNNNISHVSLRLKALLGDATSCMQFESRNLLPRLTKTFKNFRMCVWLTAYAKSINHYKNNIHFINKLHKVYEYFIKST